MVYLLFYETEETGDREVWNTFYTPVEVFGEVGTRNDRIKALRKIHPNIEFHEIEVEVK